MIFFYGTRHGKIKTYNEHQYACKECQAFDLEVKVYEDYTHIFLAPFFPIGNKQVRIHCNNCGSPFRLYVLEQEIEKKARAPLYYYSLTILFSCLIIALIFFGIKNHKKEKENIANPLTGDVYLIKANKPNLSGYYFLKVIGVNQQSVLVYHSAGVYDRFLSKMQPDDYFQKNDTLEYTRKGIKEMYEKQEIASVQRGYDNSAGFNNIR